VVSHMASTLTHIFCVCLAQRLLTLVHHPVFSHMACTATPSGLPGPGSGVMLVNLTHFFLGLPGPRLRIWRLLRHSFCGPAWPRLGLTLVRCPKNMKRALGHEGPEKSLPYRKFIQEPGGRSEAHKIGKKGFDCGTASLALPGPGSGGILGN